MRAEFGISPAATIEGSVQSAVWDRAAARGTPRGGRSVQMVAAVGIAAGGPSAMTITAQVQDSADGSTDWQPIGDPIVVTEADGAPFPIINKIFRSNLNLNGRRRHLRINLTADFTGGTAPSIPVCVIPIFGGREAA